MDNHITNKSIRKNFTPWVLMFFGLFSYLSSASQNEEKFTVRFKLSVNSGNYKNALISITKNGSPFKVIDPDGSVKSVELDLGAQYTVTCSKMGYITKTVTFNTNVPNGRAADEFRKFKCEVEIFPQPEDKIITFSQPVGRIQYNIELGDFDYDKNYANTALEMQKQATEQAVPAPKEVAPPPPPPPPPPPKEKEKVVSNPIPIEIKQPEVLHEPPPPPKKKETPPVIPEKKIEKSMVEKIFQDDRKKTTLVTVTINKEDIVYKKEEYNWGAVYFYKNNVYITEGTFNSETE